jgi:MFS family permease
MGASTLTGIFVKLPAGALSDLLGRRRLLLAGALVFAAMPFTYLAVSTLALLIVLRFLHGSATAIFGPVASASLSDLAPPASRGTWLSTYSTTQGAGQALGPVVAGYLIAAGRFDLAFITAGVIGLGVPLIVAGWRGAPLATSNRGSWPEFRRGVMEVLRDRLVLVTSGAQAAQFVLNGMLNAFLPLYGREALGLTATELGWLFGVQTLTTLAGDWIPLGSRGTPMGHRDRPDDLQCGGLLAVACSHCIGSRRRGDRLRRGSGHDDRRDERIYHGRHAAGPIWGGPRRVRHDLRRG